MRNHIRLLLVSVLLAGMLLSILPASAAGNKNYSITPENCIHFQDLLSSLSRICEQRSENDLSHIQDVVAQITRISPEDGFLADAIASHWLSVFLHIGTPYRDHLFVWDRAHSGRAANELKYTDLDACDAHAFIVLGYQLTEGQMTEELKGRCEAAAAAARYFPDSVLICSGGATGSNNPERHTEADRMKEYLVSVCGIEASRIFTDPDAMSTMENIINAFSIVREHDLHTVTVVTSDYHQKWGAVLCNAEAALEYLKYGYSVRLVENYSYYTASSRTSHTSAMSQLTSLLRLNGYRTPQIPTADPGN